ncbi:MAG: AAA family ATPase [Candidatus Heimdallarchaeota archaeon]|nr:AAA family ATPase [Candidatus Heimdallarchaeota archaeon]
MTLRAILEKTNLTYLFLGGKGGVGKTISASAIGIKLTKYFNRVLIVSTDPAHSLSDCFDQDLSGGEPVRIDGVEGNLYGMELEAEKGMADLQRISSLNVPGMGAYPGMDNTMESNPFFGGNTTTDEFGEEQMNMQDALGLGSDLMGGGASLPPGSDEAFAFGKLLEFIEDSDYDVVIFDTAPTGHTLRLLSLPDFLDSFVGRMIKMRMKLGNLFEAIKGMFGGRQEKDQSLEMLESLKQVITKARIELADDAKTEFIPVMIPTMMALYETERLLNTLRDYGIPVEHLIINQLIPENIDCPFCSKRYKIQEKTMLTIKQYFNQYDLVKVPMLPQEIRGIDQLKMLAEILFKEENEEELFP